MAPPSTRSEAQKQLLFGCLYLIGAVLLLPGFYFIIPRAILHIPVAPHAVPDWDHGDYKLGIILCICGCAFVIGGAVADLTMHIFKSCSLAVSAT